MTNRESSYSAAERVKGQLDKMSQGQPEKAGPHVSEHNESDRDYYDFAIDEHGDTTKC